MARRRGSSGSQSAAKVVAVFLAAFVAVHPPLKLWVPWAAESFVASIIGRPWGWRQHPWQPLAAAPVPPVTVPTINATALANGAAVDLTRPLLVRRAATAEALELFSVEHGFAAGITNARFEHNAGTTKWKYRGQLTPKNKVLECEVHLKSVEKGAGKATVIADGYLVVDSLRVYEVIDMRLDIVSGFEPPRQSPAAGGVALPLPKLLRRLGLSYLLFAALPEESLVYFRLNYLATSASSEPNQFSQGKLTFQKQKEHWR